MKDQTICIIPVGFVEKSPLEEIAGSVECTFRLPVQIMPVEQIPSHTPGLLHDGKYNSTALLLYLCQNKKVPENTAKILAVTRLDLYSPIFTHLYGEAQLRGTCAVMSLHRLRQEFYDLPPEPALFLSRCRKEAVHELGHTFGLVHCHDTNCIMHPSSTIDDTDTKSETFCSSCEMLKGRKG
jgi:archaemetzincin